MKIKNGLKVAIALFIMCACFIINATISCAAGQDLQTGTYTTKEGQKIIVNGDGTVAYEGTYSLTVTANDKGDKLTGKIGTDNKSVTFYQLNNSKIVSPTAVNYKHAGATVNLYEYTVFSLEATPVVDENGNFEVWSNGAKINTYADLQSAVDAATDGDTVKITKDLDVAGGVYIKGKKVTIDGENHTLNGATWLNSVFIVEDDATLNVKNLTLEGGAEGFEVDYDAVTFTNTTIPLKKDSDKSDIKQTLSPIISKGNFNADNINVNNYYTTAGAINVFSGNITVKNSKFNHNRASSRGAAICSGRNFRSGETTYPVKSIVIDNCEINSSYSIEGAGIHSYNTESIEIKNSSFKKNTATQGSGGAIRFGHQGGSGGFFSAAEKLGLINPQAKIDNCVFDGNWAGNDGFAIEEKEADMFITNSIFKNNVGPHPTSSIGVISCINARLTSENLITIKNCIFEKNKGTASVLGDHASISRFEISDSKFLSNQGRINALFYSANVVYKNCEFEDECVQEGVVEIRPYFGPSTDMGAFKPFTLVFDDVTFNNTHHDVRDIYVYKNKHNLSMYEATIVIEGDTKANIDIWEENILKVNGNLTGDINKDAITPIENIIINEGAQVNGEIKYNTDTYNITLIFPNFRNGFETERNVYSEAKTFTPVEFFMEHFVFEDGYMLEYYTDSKCTTKWDYNVSKSMSVYGKWVEHKHEYGERVLLYENAIHEQCECGYLGKSLKLEEPKGLVENDKEQKVIVNDEIGIEDSEYSIVYKVKNEEGAWQDIEGAPIKKGTYKAILTYKDMSIEKEYSIAEKIVVPDDSSDTTNDGNEKPDDKIQAPEDSNDTTGKLENEGNLEVKPDNSNNATNETGTESNEGNEAEKPEDVKDITNKQENPKTSDSILIAILIFVISVVAIVLIFVFIKKKK